MKSNYIIGFVRSKAMDIPQVSTILNYGDFFGAMMVRWSINRDNYKVNPGVYAVGNPNENSDVFVTANYKLSFDTLRKNLHGLNVWILILDTRGINVWCAAGKGTFGTKELMNRINMTSLNKIVSHKRLILPQLGAVGVAAHVVKLMTGFNVTYGPVNAKDIKAFINNGYKATKEMRKVKFPFVERLKLVPVEFVFGLKYLFGAIVFLFIMTGLNLKGYSLDSSLTNGIRSIFNLIIAYITGVAITPLMLPYIPARSFALKGFITGLAVALLIFILNLSGNILIEKISWFFIITGLSSFLAMNFTGASTYTSLSGVKKEMKIALPFQITFASIGLITWIIGRLI